MSRRRGIQPSIIKDIERVIRLLADRGDMAILLVEQYFDFAVALADQYLVLDRGQVILAGQAASMEEEKVRAYLTVNCRFRGCLLDWGP